jgi:hypothetical protein
VTTTINHPASCKDPDNCDLTYRDHLVGFGLSSSAIPNHAVTRTPGMPNELTADTITREKRWERDNAAFRRLNAQGLMPPQINGSALREREGKTESDITERHVTIDWKDPN